MSDLLLTYFILKVKLSNMFTQICENILLLISIELAFNIEFLKKDLKFSKHLMQKHTLITFFLLLKK